jgi:hypothetical protein
MPGIPGLAGFGREMEGRGDLLGRLGFPGQPGVTPCPYLMAVLPSVVMGTVNHRDQ